MTIFIPSLSHVWSADVNSHLEHCDKNRNHTKSFGKRNTRYLFDRKTGDEWIRSETNVSDGTVTNFVLKIIPDVLYGYPTNVRKEK